MKNNRKNKKRIININKMTVENLHFATLPWQFVKIKSRISTWLLMKQKTEAGRFQEVKRIQAKHFRMPLFENALKRQESIFN